MLDTGFLLTKLSIQELKNLQIPSGDTFDLREVHHIHTMTSMRVSCGCYSIMWYFFASGFWDTRGCAVPSWKSPGASRVHLTCRSWEIPWRFENGIFKAFLQMFGAPSIGLREIQTKIIKITETNNVKEWLCTIIQPWTGNGIQIAESTSDGANHSSKNSVVSSARFNLNYHL